MGGPYNIPRNYKGEGKILFIFSGKALVYSAVGGGVGLIFYYLFKMLRLTMVGIICALLFALIGFCIGTFKMPENSKFEITRKTGGENIDQVILRWIKFKKNNNKIYIYKEEVNKDV